MQGKYDTMKKPNQKKRTTTANHHDGFSYNYLQGTGYDPPQSESCSVEATCTYLGFCIRSIIRRIFKGKVQAPNTQTQTRKRCAVKMDDNVDSRGGKEAKNRFEYEKGNKREKNTQRYNGPTSSTSKLSFFTGSIVKNLTQRQKKTGESQKGFGSDGL
jgi:hypothetical protein